MKKLVLFAALLLFPLLAASVARADTAMPAQLTAQDRFDMGRIESYLNGLKNVTADFMQMDDAGGMMRGVIAISRPGKMRVSYSGNGDFIVADGTYVHIWDDSLKSQNTVPQNSSLAEFILRDPVRLGGDVTVTKFARYPAKLEVTLVQTDDPGQGSLTLIFEDKPMKLRQWKVVDAQNHTTGVNLENLTEVPTLSPSLFVFAPPSAPKN